LQIANFYKNDLAGMYKSGNFTFMPQNNHKTWELFGWLCSCISFLKLLMNKTRMQAGMKRTPLVLRYDKGA
jgi:hypothetical protein